MESRGSKTSDWKNMDVSSLSIKDFLFLLTNIAEKIKRSTSAFSLHHQFIIFKSSGEKKDSHQLEDTILMQHQILRTDIKENLRETEENLTFWV